MKKFAKFIIVFVLLLSISIVFAGCDMFTLSGDNATETLNENEQQETNQNQNDNEDEKEYVELIDDILDFIQDDKFLDALTMLLDNIPIEQISPLLEPYIGEENSELIKTYYQQAVEILPIIGDVMPIIKKIQPHLNESDIIMNGALALIGATRTNENTFEWQNYTISFGENDYTITKDNQEYIISYRENYRYISCIMTDTDTDTTKLAVESNCINTDFDFQYFDYENKKLVQVLIKAATLDATISMQSNIEELPYSIKNGITSEFATKGDLMYFDKFDLINFVEGINQ